MVLVSTDIPPPPPPVDAADDLAIDDGGNHGLALSLKTFSQKWIYRLRGYDARGSVMWSPAMMAHTKRLRLIIAMTLLTACTTVNVTYSRKLGSLNYSPALVLTVSETLKIIIASMGCVSLGSSDVIKREMRIARRHWFQISLPAILYACANNIGLNAIKELPGGIYQTVLQLRLFWAAMLSWIVLNRTLSASKIYGIILLLVGLCIINFDSYTFRVQSSTKTVSRLFIAVGFVVVQTFLAALGGVMWEKVIKLKPVPENELLPGNPPLPLNGPIDDLADIEANATPDTRATAAQFTPARFHSVEKAATATLVPFRDQLVGVLTKNVILAMATGFITATLLLSKDIYQMGFYGIFDAMIHNTLPWKVAFFQASTGLLTGIVFLLADNVARYFTIGLATVACLYVSYFNGEIALSFLLTVGTVLVLLATGIYSLPVPDDPTTYPSPEVQESPRVIDMEWKKPVRLPSLSLLDSPVELRRKESQM